MPSEDVEAIKSLINKTANCMTICSDGLSIQDVRVDARAALARLEKIEDKAEKVAVENLRDWMELCALLGAKNIQIEMLQKRVQTAEALLDAKEAT